MKVNIRRHYMNKKHGWVDWPDEKDYTKYEKLLGLVDDVLQSVYNASINQIIKHRKRKVEVRIDDEDLWSMDHTLSLIILPMLKRLKEIKHGSPYIDYDDVPQELRPTEEPGPDNYYTDNTIHKRWEWVLDEMIWTFEQIADVDAEYVHWDGKKWDMEARKAQQDRMNNGLRLFGKYYRGLWD
jgi:hypothetical protein